MLDAQSFQSETVKTRSRYFSISRSDVLVAVLLLLTIFVGGYLRFMSNNWDDFIRFHPDERYLATVVVSLNTTFKYEPNCEEWNTNCLDRLAQYNHCLQKYPATGGRGTFFDTECSLWHPENTNYPHYVYGTLPLFMTRLAAEFMVDTTGDPVWLRYDAVFQVWRTLSAAAETITIFLTFLIGLRLHGKWVGLLAAVLYAFAVFPIQQAHFGTTDAITTMFVVAALYCAVRAQDNGSWWDYAAFGVALGAAVASRVNVAPLAAVIVVVAILRALPGFDRRLPWNERNRILTHHVGGVLIAAAMSFIVFRLCQPYAFAGPSIFGILPDHRYIETLAHAQFTVSGESESPPNYQWINRTGYVFPWQNMVLWGMGIALGLTAWVSWAWSGWRLIRGRESATRNLVLFAWIAGYFLFVGNLWVMSMRYYLPLYSPLAVLAAWGLVELLRRTHRPNISAWRKYGARALAALVVGYTILWALMFTNIYRHMATFTQASHWVWENVPGDFAMRIDGAPDDVPLLNVALWNSFVSEQTPIEDYLLTQSTRLGPLAPLSGAFTATHSGTVSTIYAPHIGDPFNQPTEKTIEVTITNPASQEMLARAELTAVFERDEHVLGSDYEFAFDESWQVEAGREYMLNVTLTQGDALITSGAVMALESQWEEPMPAKVCRLPDGITLADSPPSGLNTISNCNGRSVWEGLLNGYLLQTHFEDVETHRHRYQTILDQTDYIMIPTNRRYDTQSRNPVRWPMTNRMYDALFSGELGFELEAYFQETFELSPLKVSDQYLPIYDAPQWLNEFESEEAFSVYDHPVVFVYRKTDDYSSENTAAILNGVPLTRVGEFFPGYNDPNIANVITWSSLAVDKAPTALQFTEDQLEIQRQGGTWSNRFNLNSIINTNQVVTVMIWWIAIMVFGFVAWPLLFFAFPALADRGYGFAKFMGMLLVGWSAWFLSSVRIAVWSQYGLLAVLIAFGLISAWIVNRNRRKFSHFLKTRIRLLVWIELASFVLYLLFIGVRLTNPDLWHNIFGGEKPMDFAYFNGVLRSTIFPPVDPWYADGYINYYYFGYVIVGTPTLLLGVMPALAYNLILPTLFSVTGMGAFSTAFSIVNGWRGKPSHVAEPNEANDTSDVAESSVNGQKPLGNPWVAGIAALMLAVILGNLGTINEIGIAAAKLGGHAQPTGLQDFLVDEFVDENGYQPDFEEITTIANRASSGRLDDRLRYEWHNTTSLIGGVFIGFGKWLSGETLYISPERWFWGPTRIITEAAQGGDGAIHEMPFFTFLYGDLHAHMIAMPMMLFTLAFVYNELMTAGRDRRRWSAKWPALFCGGLTVGLFQATNTWDYPTFLILSVLGLAYAWWLHWKIVSRWSLLSVIGRIGGFFAIGYVAALPYTAWFASALTTFKVWEGKKTALWIYFSIHGVFLFLILALFVWETGRWLRSARVADLRGKLPILWSVLAGITLVLLGSLILAAADYQVALIVVPAIALIAILFFRPGQSRPMQFVLVLAGLGLVITLGTEFITLAIDNGRQNTIFKFYIQVWLLFSVVGGTALAWVVRNSILWRASLAVPFFAVGGVLFFIALMYPIQATRGKAEYRFSKDVPLTLDGMQYMNYARHIENGVREAFTFDHDYNVIRWLQQNVEGSPVIIEALSGTLLYQWGGRISINTGLPSVMGWNHHQKQQRSLDPLPTLVDHRVANVNAFYSTHDINAAVDILRFYDVTYVILSNYEQVRYGEPEFIDGEPNPNPDPLAKFDEMVERDLLRVVFDDGVARIFEVNKDQLRMMAVAQAAAQLETQIGE